MSIRIVVLLFVLFFAGCVTYDSDYYVFQQGELETSRGHRKVYTKPEQKVEATQEQKTAKQDSEVKATPSTPMRIFVYKKARKMFVFNGDNLVGEYTIALGRTPEGDKLRRGDKRTPEGEFYICSKKISPRFGYSLGISYPSPVHAERGVKNRIVNDAVYKRVLLAYKNREVPPWDTPLGGHIYIHGGGTIVDWTDGCIAMENKDVKFLYGIIEVGTPVMIYP